MLSNSSALTELVQPNSPHSDPECAGCGHAIQLYEDEKFLVATVTDLIRTSIDRGGKAVVIATAAHLQSIHGSLRESGIDPDEAIAGDRYLPLDAAETLAQLMFDGRPDEESFKRVVGDRVARMSENSEVSAFGEMVSMLWLDGKRDAALALEKLWNTLLHRHSFSLLCAYPVSAFSDYSQAEHFKRICEEHTRVIPAESFDPGAPLDAQYRAIALLQQQAASLRHEIAERKRVELENEVADRSSRRLAAIVESSEDAIISKDLNGVITSWNAGAERIFGYTAAEIIGKPVITLIPHERRYEETSILQRIRRGDRIEHYETIRQRKDGSRIEISLTVSPLRDRRGRIIGASKIARDITERKRNEQALRASQEHFQTVFDNTPECIKIISPEGVVLSMNAAGCAIIEAKISSQVVGRSIFEFIAPEDREAFRKLNDRVCAGTKEFLEFQMISLSGMRRWMETHAAPIWDPDRKCLVHLAVARDITRRKEAEEAIHKNELLFRQLADSMPQIVWAARADGYVDYYNQRWYEYTGFSGVFGDESWIPVLHPDDVARTVESFFECVRQERPYQVEYRFKDRKNGGYRWFLGRALPVRDDSGRVIRWFGTCTDIDQQKRTEEILEQKVQERTASLREAIAQMEEFSYTVSHDLRTPLRGMHAYSSILLEDYSGVLDPEAIGYLEKINQNAVRLDQMIRDVLRFARVARSQLKLTRISIANLVEDVIKHHPQMQPPHAEIQIEPLMDVMGDEPSLVQAVSNLLTNAVKFVPRGRVPKVLVRNEPVGDDVRLWIEDNGIGIDPRYQHRLFGLFERIHPHLEQEGSGIGLAIVRKAVERMGGKAGVDSDGRSGSRFWIQLRRAD